MNCSIHHSREAEYRCERCGTPICESCYDTNKMHYCPKCFRKAVADEAKEAEGVIKVVKKELKFIYAGLIVGAIASIALLISLFVQYGVEGLAMGAFWAFFIPFICGSLGTLLKRLFRGLKGSGDDGWWLAIIMVMVEIAIAPITTIRRIIIRKKDIRRATEIYNDDMSGLPLIDQYIANANTPSAVEMSANGAGDVEISLDAILASGVGSDAALCANGEILRTIRER